MALSKLKNNFWDDADRVIRGNKNENRNGRGFNFFNGLTTTKLRGIYGLIMNIYTKISEPDDFEKFKPEIKYLKVKMAYEAGREQSVKKFISETKLMAYIDDIKDYDDFVLYCQYAESLVAYFKFHGGKDK